MEFRLLGPLEVLEHDRSCELGGGKQRALLALLLLHANEVVPTERLIDELWGESPPATVAKGIQVYVSRLRKQLGDRRLVTRKPGYVLLVDASELDVARFERLLADADGADPEVAARKLREALALWRGAPLADLAYEPWAQAEIARLDELHTGALERRIEADLALGRHSQLIGELERLVEELPLREGLRGQLMLCLYRCGRQAEALEVYRATREVLVDELGIEPGRELRELEQAILRQDPALDLPAPETVGEPERESVGREIRGGRAALEGERKQVTVLFADVVESMELAERTDPEEWRRVMDRLFSILCEGVHRFEGTVDKFTGDGIMALFGAPVAHEDHARRACSAALYLQRGLAAYADDLRRRA